VKTAAEKVNAMSRTPDDGIHPMSRILFGWTEAKGIGGIIFWGMAGLSIVLVLLDLVIVRHEKMHSALCKSSSVRGHKRAIARKCW
jgi:hypothetical protein